ncbi:MAG: DapH/DapD/GlmU-related protein [bacterium]|nr:DapH/DapD/GlmU-related protein [bacterium]
MKRASIHGSSFVERGARVGAGTRIWHFCHVRAGARIGRGCTLGQGVHIGRGVRVGDGVKIQNNVSVFEGVTIERDVFCGPSVVFTNVRDPRAAYPKDPAAGYLPTLVREGATLGANATILCGITIGRHAFVGAGAVVTRDVPDHALVCGNPARLAGWVCRCGARLAPRAGRAACGRCGRRYARAAISPRRAAVRPRGGRRS